MRRQLTGEFITTELEPGRGEWERRGGFPRDLWLAFARRGLLAPHVPTEHGGAGAPLADSISIIEELASAGLESVAISINVHANIFVSYLLADGTAEQRARYLPRMCTGELVGAVAITGAESGSVFGANETTARRDSDGWIIDGHKLYVTNGRHCDVAAVLARTAETTRGGRGATAFLVDTAAEGVIRGERHELIGLRAADTCPLSFSGVRVAADAVLGSVDRGVEVVMRALVAERLGIAAQAVGCAEGVMRETLAFVQSRRVGDRFVSDFQNTRFVIAELLARARTARVFLDDCVRRHSDGTLDGPTSAMLKLHATETQDAVIDGCLQLWGTAGYLAGSRIGRSYVDARAQRIYGGTSEMMKEVVWKAAVAQPDVALDRRY